MLERLLRRQRLMTVFGGVLPLAVGCLALAGAMLFAKGALCCPGLFFSLVGLVLLTSWKDNVGKMLAPLAAYGDGDPWRALRRIDAEIDAGREVLQFGAARRAALSVPPGFAVLTPSWLVRVGPAKHSICAVPIADILWVFVRRCTSAPGDLKEHAQGVRIYCRDDRWERIPLDDPVEMDEPIAELLRRRPGIAVGYRDELLKELAEGPQRLAELVKREEDEWPATFCPDCLAQLRS